jgi:hypothetical protein
MIIDDFHICWTFLCPAEANAKLTIYPDAMLPDHLSELRDDCPAGIAKTPACVPHQVA